MLYKAKVHPLYVRRYQQCHAFTILELLVVIAILAILFSLTLAAIQKVRESSGRLASVNNLHQLNTAIHTYANSNQGRLPLISSDADATGTAFFTMLPYLEQAPLHHQGSTQPAALAGVPLRVLQAPLDRSIDPAADRSSYACNHFVFSIRPMMPTSFSDGTSQTILFAERASVTYTPKQVADYGNVLDGYDQVQVGTESRQVGTRQVQVGTESRQTGTRREPDGWEERRMTSQQLADYPGQRRAATYFIWWFDGFFGEGGQWRLNGGMEYLPDELANNLWYDPRLTPPWSTYVQKYREVPIYEDFPIYRDEPVFQDFPIYQDVPRYRWDVVGYHVEYDRINNLWHKPSESFTGREMFHVQPAPPPSTDARTDVPHAFSSAGLHVGLADGSARLLAPIISQSTWEALLTPAGNDVVEAN